MKFTKMHGLGNDYVYINGFETRVDDPARLARAVSDRHIGIGSDGVILIEPSTTADVKMVMYNADGSRSRMCGNGLRCVAKYAVDHNLTPSTTVRVETDAGLRIAECQIHDNRVQSVKVDMGEPRLDAAAIPVIGHGDQVIDTEMRIGECQYRVTCVSMGNPHAVVFVDDLESVDLAANGPLFEFAPAFPERTNAHFVQVHSPAELAMKSWERGAGPTRACGSGACAVCVAAVATNRAERVVTVRLPGGKMALEWSGNNHVFMTGPAVEVFTGTWPE